MCRVLYSGGWGVIYWGAKCAYLLGDVEFCSSYTDRSCKPWRTGAPHRVIAFLAARERGIIEGL